MFDIPRVNVIESDAGFAVEILGRVGMEYRESDKVMLVDCEILMTKEPAVAIWRDRIRNWKPPHDKEQVDEEQRIEILKNICAALKWRNIQVQIHSQTTGWVKGWLE